LKDKTLLGTKLSGFPEQNESLSSSLALSGSTTGGWQFSTSAGSFGSPSPAVP